MTRLVLALVPFVLASCTADPSDDGALGQIDSALSQGLNDNGTRLSVVSSSSAVECDEDGSGGDVTVSYTVTSTAAADHALVTASVDGVEAQIGEIASGTAGWTFDGRTKTAEGSVTYSLANGDHTIEVCVTQDGANGRLPKRTCAQVLSVSVDCDWDKETGSGCNQGIGNGAEGCDPGDSNHNQDSNDEGGDNRGNGNGQP